MRACVIQFDPGTDKGANIATAERLITAAAAEAAPDLISLPEMWTCLGGSLPQKMAQAEPLPLPGREGTGAAWRFLSETARRHRAFVHGGSIAEQAGERLFNTTLVFGRDGREIGRYRKIHLFDITTPGGQGYRESAAFGAGEEVVTCRLDEAVGGLSICYDLRFAELYLALRRAGSVIIFVPAAFTAETGRDHWEILVRARAIETQCWVVAAATCGFHTAGDGQKRQTFGHSLICDPWGRVCARLAEAPGHASAGIDLGEAARVRRIMPVFEHRRLS